VSRLRMRAEGAIFYLAGEFDLAEVEMFAETTAARLDGQGPVILDLTELTFMDASGINSILKLAERVGGRGLVVRNPRGEVARVLGIVRLADVPGIDIERGESADRAS
jgi:anti-anti-sigma factor